MYPTRINLLSTEKRKYLRRMIYFQFIKNTLTSLVIVFCISGITLLSGQWILQEYFNDVSGNLVATNGYQNGKNKKIKETNDLISQINALQQVNTQWSNTMVQIGNAIPDKVVLKNLSLNSENKIFIFSGTADTRADLLEMQTNLEQLDFIENVDIPLSQLTEKENLLFTISAIPK